MNKLVIILLLVICGCQETNEQLTEKRTQLKNDISLYKSQKEELLKEIENIKVDKAVKLGEEYYILGLELSQSHFTLDLGEHMKDAMNVAKFEISVDKRFYEASNIGDSLNKDFRVGSFIMNGSFGNWNVKIKSKRISY